MKFFLMFFVALILMLFVGLAVAQTTVLTPEDIFTNLGVNVAVVLAIIAFTSVFKSFLKPTSSILKYIAFFPMLVSALYAFILGGYVEVTQKVIMTFLYAAAAGYLYSLGGNIAKSLTNAVTGSQIFKKVK